MKRILIFLLPLVIAAIVVQPANAQTNRFTASTGDVTLAGTALTLTVQKPAPPSGDLSGGKPVTLESFTVYCSVPCNVTQAYNGTAASATAATVTPIPPNTTVNATATAWSASNVGAGTAVPGTIHIGQPGSQAIDVSKVVINGVSTAANYSVTVAAISGTANIVAIWSEKQ